MLAVGTLEPRKNLARVVEATARAGVELRLVGAPGWGDAGVAGKHVTWLGRIDDEELAAAYRGARCLVFPSLYEGFGIPALEAMACGTPVVTSAGSAMEEVVGDAAVLVDPLDVASIAAGIEEADRRRDELVPLGLERAAGTRGSAPVEAAVAALPAGARMTAPLVVVDADVLGRRRTGDETLRREPAARAGERSRRAGLRIAAATRHPELVPAGIEPLVLATPVQELRMLWTLPRLLRRTGAALVHTQYAVPARSPCPAVVTIHDLSFEHDPEHMSLKDRLVFRRVVPRAARARAARADGLGAHARRPRRLYGLPEEKVVVTPNGVDPAFTPGNTLTLGTYVLAVGAVQPRKNQLAALAAAAAVAAAARRRRAGQGRGARGAAARRGADLRGYVAQEELAELYRGAACLVQPSRYEGFGLPVLEAMACGTPVVALDEPALREVAGDAAVFVDEEHLADGDAARARGARAAARRPGSSGRRRSAGASTAERTLEVYREALA